MAHIFDGVFVCYILNAMTASDKASSVMANESFLPEYFGPIHKRLDFVIVSTFNADGFTLIGARGYWGTMTSDFWSRNGRVKESNHFCNQRNIQIIKWQ